MGLKAGAHSDPKALANALRRLLTQDPRAEIDAVGAGAVNQAIKAIAIARGGAAAQGQELTCAPVFIRVQLDGSEKTAIRLIVVAREALAS